MGTTVGGRIGFGLLAWLGGLSLLAFAAHPERCPGATPDEVMATVEAAVGWIAANQEPDGAFLYRYDRDAQEDLGGYNVVRHAGTLVALEQSAALGVPEAEEAAERGREWALDRLTELDGDRAALTADTGATALLVAAMVEHRRATGSTDDDDELRALGRFLESTVTGEGAVVAAWDLDADEPVAGSRSPFFTGEAHWALARLHTAFPDEGWDEPARRVSRYLATERDDAERRFPPVSDHWAAYGWDEISAWPADLSEEELEAAARHAELFGVQVRYESQRRGEGITRLTRGRLALTSGLGTLGEGLGGIQRLAERDPRLDVDREAVADRLSCVAGLLVERQLHTDDPRDDGAWFREGVTQVDGQQHAISALLAALPVLEDR